MDPNFGVLLGDNLADKCVADRSVRPSTNVNTNILIGVLVGVGGGVIVAVLGYFFVYKKVMLWRKVQKARAGMEMQTTQTWQ